MNLNDTTPSYLVGKYQLIGAVTFAALFGVVYLSLSVPFSDVFWFKLDASDTFVLTILFVFSTLFLMILSKRILCFLGGKISFPLWMFLLSNIIEFFAVALLYSCITAWGVAHGIIVREGSFMLDLTTSFGRCFFALGVPYVISWLYFAIEDKDNTIRLMNYGNVISDEVVQPHDEKKITLFDNNGTLKLSVNSKNLYYIESDDNYIKVWYTDVQDVLKQYMLRCRLKTVEESFIDSNLVRCHRKYIVNLEKVKVLKKEKDSYQFELDNQDIPLIPITKTYEENILARFNSMKSV